MEQYNAKSCNNLEKLFYRPIEVALRWCNLIDHESAILASVGTELVPPKGAFPQWPCLTLNTEKIWAAIFDGEMPHGRDGRTVPDGENVRKDRITVKHTDLRAWMAKTYPDQKPEFLFDEIERTTHSAISAESVRALQVERDACKARNEKAVEEWKKLKKDRDAIASERDSLAAMVEGANAPGARAETTYLNIIGGLLGLMLGKTPAGIAQSVFQNQAAIISAMLAHHSGKPGISDTTLEQKFAEANRSIRAT
ncbi:MAG: protein kinase [Comamonadaceae bacterium]|nr:protein kinase [Comamonadaceae bacterium]